MGKLAKLAAGMVAAAAGVLQSACNHASGWDGDPMTPLPAGVSFVRPPMDPKLLETEPEVVNGFLKLDFDRLADFQFGPSPYDLPDPRPGSTTPLSAEQIPDAIKKLDGRGVVVTGFMLPAKMQGGLVTEFLLFRFPPPMTDSLIPDWAPRLNEWVVVRVTEGVRVVMDTPVAFFGIFHVRAEFDNGYLTSIYQLDGDVVEVAKP